MSRHGRPDGTASGRPGENYEMNDARHNPPSETCAVPL